LIYMPLLLRLLFFLFFFFCSSHSACICMGLERK
jgi:hypothetical protein